MSARLLELNPEVYTVWNYRREAIAPTVDSGGDAAVEAISDELHLTQRALMRNPKSYSTWHHRKWAIEKNFSSLEHELELVEQLLNVDCRNFHGWGYRLYIARRMGLPIQRELDYARRKIEQNFSNYSAWHYRSIMLPLAFQVEQNVLCEGDVLPLLPFHLQKADAQFSIAALSTADELHRVKGTSVSAEIPAHVLDEEFDFVKQAFYTEPGDQSAWFYHRWLLGCAVARYHRAMSARQDQGGGHRDIIQSNVAAGKTESQLDANDSSIEIMETSRQDLLQTLVAQEGVCNEVLQLEPESKWALLTLAGLRELRSAIGTQKKMKSKEDGGTEEEVQQIYRRLELLDPMRRQFYADRAVGKADVIRGLKRD